MHAKFPGKLVLVALALLAMLTVPTMVPKQGAELPADKMAVMQFVSQWEASAQAAPIGSKAVTAPPSSPEPPHAWGLLPGDNGPVPLPARVCHINNKWLGQVGGTFTAVYAGAMTANPQQGVLVVFQPDSPSPAPHMYAMPKAAGSLTLTGVDGSTARFSYPGGGQGSFDLATGQFR